MVAPPDIIIIRGAPGSGKSQVAKALSSFYPKGVRLEVDTLRNMVISVNWTDQKEHIQLLEVAAELTKNFLKRKLKPAIVVDTFSGNKLEKFLKDLQNRKKKVLKVEIFSLYCSDAELVRRLKARKIGGFKDFEISKEINVYTQNLKFENEIKIDTTTLSVKEIAGKFAKEWPWLLNGNYEKHK